MGGGSEFILGGFSRDVVVLSRREKKREGL